MGEWVRTIAGGFVSITRGAKGINISVAYLSQIVEDDREKVCSLTLSIGDAERFLDELTAAIETGERVILIGDCLEQQWRMCKK